MQIIKLPIKQIVNVTTVEKELILGTLSELQISTLILEHRPMQLRGC